MNRQSDFVSSPSKSGMSKSNQQKTTDTASFQSNQIAQPQKYTTSYNNANNYATTTRYAHLQPIINNSPVNPNNNYFTNQPTNPPYSPYQSSSQLDDSSSSNFVASAAAAYMSNNSDPSQPNYYMPGYNSSNYNSNHLKNPSPSFGYGNTQNKYQTNKPSSNYGQSSTAYPYDMNHTQSQSESKSLINDVISLIYKLNLKLIAFDFDCTIVTIHTGGQWMDSPEKLAEFVRPAFRELIPALLKCNDLCVCVVTFSSQEKLIYEVLRISMKDEPNIDDLLSKLVIKGNTREFLEEHGPDNCYTSGKEIHLECCRKYFETLNPRYLSKEFVNVTNANNSLKSVAKINNASMLLIDDDFQNLRIAERNNHLAFEATYDTQLIDLYNFLSKNSQK